MESAAMRVEVVSPERVLFSGEATQVITRTLGGGEIAFLNGHAPFLGALDYCHTRIYLADGKVEDLASKTNIESWHSEHPYRSTSQADRLREFG